MVFILERQGTNSIYASGFYAQVQMSAVEIVSDGRAIGRPFD
jgi:hypothetical protein